MNRALEFHDSEVGAILREGDNVVIRFTSAYIHESEGIPAQDDGTGWTQAAELVIGGGVIEGTYPDFPCWISDGTLECEDTVLANVLPLPFRCQERIRLELVFTIDSTVTIVGDNAVLNLHGEAKFVEDFRAPPANKSASRM